MDQAIFVRGDDGVVVVKPDVVYPHYLHLAKVKTPTQLELELVRRALTEDIASVLGAPLTLRILKGDGRWALRNFPSATGNDEAAVMGNAGLARDFYAALPGTPARRLGIV
jgi:hypothetical protein